METGHDRQVAEGRGRAGREGRAALRGRHRQGDAGGRGRGERRAARRSRSSRARCRSGRRSRLIGEPGERASSRPSRPRPSRTPPRGARRASQPPKASSARVINGARDEPNGRVKASPLARRIARERGIDLARAHAAPGPTGGSSPRTSSAAQAGNAAPRRRRPRYRRGEVESRAAHERPQDDRAPADRRRGQVPAFQLTVVVDMTQRERARREARASSNPDVRVTVTDLLASVCAQALMRHRDMNVQFTEDALLRFPTREHRHRRRGAAGARRARRPRRSSGSRSPRSRARRGDARRPRPRRASCAPRTSRAARSRSRTSACSASSSSSPCSTRRRRRSSRSAPRATGRSRVDGELVVRPMMTMTLTCRPPRRRRRDRRRVPPDGEDVPRRSRARALR